MTLPHIPQQQMAHPECRLQAAIFDMDGVITQTASIHAAAWKVTFDEILRQHATPGADVRLFDDHADYYAYVDGKPRIEGVRAFVRARGIALSAAEEEQAAERKDQRFIRIVHERGVKTFPSTVALVGALRAMAVKTAVVTSSRHGRELLQSAGIAALFDASLDGIDLDAQQLAGKPDPDMFLRAAAMLGSTPADSMVVEDAVAGVEAGRRGNFGLVIGVDRGGNAAALQDAGADVVVRDLAELDVASLQAAFQARRGALGWRIEAEGYDPDRERQMESLFTVGNGYMGVRAALDSPPPGSQCDLFIAGVYDRKRADLPYSEIEFFTPSGRADPYSELVPLPFPFRVTVSVDGMFLDFHGDGANGKKLRRVLDLHDGVLHASAVHQAPGSLRTAVRTRRCASLADPHLLLQEVVVAPDDHAHDVALAATLDEPELTTRHPHLRRLARTVEGDLETVRYVTRASRICICLVSRVVRAGNVLRRLVSVFTSRDDDDPAAAALAHSTSLDPGNIDALFAAHSAKWAQFWERADIRIAADTAAEQALRFGSYHLRLPLGADEHVSIGARTLSGRAYEGHVFWDTEIFMLPFYLHTEPLQARKLLLYRYHTLPGARRRARDMGCAGACFAWESTVTGADVTPTKIVLKSSGKEIPIFTGSQQIHVTADIAYAVWRYWETTGDEAFLAGPGADILFDTARFWHSRVSRDSHRCHIRGVVGPDEYHYAVDDNAYTNWMARFNLERAAWLARQSGTHLAEADEWSGVAQSLYIPQPDERGVLEQFDGFFALDEHPLPREERFKAPVSRLYDWQQINRLKILKQADVLMLPLLFPESFSDEAVAANYRYYEPITDHGSSLSPAVHAAIAARIGLRDDAERYWKQSLWLDLSNAMDNSMLGVHPAAMGGAWQALVFGFLGMRFSDAGPQPRPDAQQRLPFGWKGIALNIAYRGRIHAVTVGCGVEQ
ncbi:HAD-IA family hydrolase [Noviherbaspirillum suwonense]|uniref:Alpha,alpha-trehalose phosphorylase/kojibiose phosphorylase n=1 Tax=Noviherbaspirillum suwonense TaxID=1224511 RepID=A0ABY1QP64_9BURK|nr:HAD-IA family hydrolase [Noviherbaspirillum suwonense]SMP75234.1 alpha,alpha-trehalose phosphorylase/kojibiose phosphorylase [Noviherbaspirillum suwonense]